MLARIFVFAILLSWLDVANASLDDFVEVDEETAAEMNAELGLDVDVYFAHVDLWEEGKDAPFIQFKIYTVDEHGEDVVGSFDIFAEFTRGKSDTFKILFVQLIASMADEHTQVMRVREYELFEELSALMYIADYIDADDNVWQQFQIMQWSDDRQKKCVIASDSSERVAAFYEDSVSDSLVELMTFCAVGLNVETDSEQTS